ncbi:flagellar motor switch protein FliN [Quadrisphaera oryzae]|uniref:flagellar motor switch protein FliN n=1 Tax=Quadrisphaera TaxID=317661 RepID=UPI0016462215|nr:flagellar motor switch protein FliN [Quadrisphaera sp. RL12-1S]MBC3763753.1 flagellar motor switch protein FliN [Quadrisphaera sp. RL12-1S]
MTTPTDARPEAAAQAAQTALLAAAAVAAEQLPSGATLAVGPSDGSLAPTADGTAVSAAFTGAVSGTLVVIVDPSLEEALAGAEGGPLPVVDAIAPALRAAVTATGPSVPGAVQAVDVAAAVAEPDALWVPLVDANSEAQEVVVWVGLLIAQTAIPSGVPSGPAVPVQNAAGRAGMALLRGVEMVVTVELGRTRMSVKDLLALTPGSVVELDRAAGAPADLLVNGRLLARGEVVVVDEDYGLRITEIVEPGAED